MFFLSYKAEKSFFLCHLCKLGLFISIYTHILVMFVCLGHLLCNTVLFMGLLQYRLRKSIIEKKYNTFSHGFINDRINLVLLTYT